MRSVEGRPLYVFSMCLEIESARHCTLAATLCVEGPDVVINDTRWFLIDVFVEDLTTEERNIVLSVHGPV
jgi:hypothetical protein